MLNYIVYWFLLILIVIAFLNLMGFQIPLEKILLKLIIIAFLLFLLVLLILIIFLFVILI